jgi:hypothetical protein
MTPSSNNNKPRAPCRLPKMRSPTPPRLPPPPLLLCRPPSRHRYHPRSHPRRRLQSRLRSRPHPSHRRCRQPCRRRCLPRPRLTRHTRHHTPLPSHPTPRLIRPRRRLLHRVSSLNLPLTTIRLPLTPHCKGLTHLGLPVTSRSKIALPRALTRALLPVTRITTGDPSLLLLVCLPLLIPSIARTWSLIRFIQQRK